MTYRAEDWKPGDLAMVSGELGTGVAVRLASRALTDEPVWMLLTLNTRVKAHGGFVRDENVTDARRLVVIDPEGRDVSRLVELIVHHGYRMSDQANLAAALREFATPTPPRPDEPTGLGAVVEDAEGVLWVQFNSVTGKWWRNHQGKNRRWSEIAAVKVLSAGVPNE